METIKRYQLLIVILLLNSIVASALAGEWMADFMGLFFVTLSMFKFFDLDGFVKGFRKYDVLAQRSMMYGYVYPFLELGLGFGYLSGVWPSVVQLATVVLMSVSAAGVIREMARGNKFQCACLGTTLNVPLSTVSILENAGMGMMALAMLVA